MTRWKRKRTELRDRHREFIYLDEVSVVSLLAGLQGEIRDAITETLARTQDQSLNSSLGVAKIGASVESHFGSSRTSTNEVVRRAVIQSTFRDLWRRDAGVLLHDTSGIKRKYRKMIPSYHGLENALPALKKLKLAVPLADITRGDIVEMDVRLEADQFFKIITVGSTLLDLINGREDLFGLSTADLRQVAPMIEVLKELLVGLVPMRGVSTSHSVIEIGSEQVVIATELLGSEIQVDAKPLELVGFAETNSFWRDLRRTLFSGSTFTVYARAEGPALRSPWSPVKIADLLKSLSPSLRDEVVAPLERLDLNKSQTSGTLDLIAAARSQLYNFAVEFRDASHVNPDMALVNQAVDAAIPLLVSATTFAERRRAFEPVAEAVAGKDADRNLLFTIRSKWIGQPSKPVSDNASSPVQPAESKVSPIELEVGFVALYW